MRLEDIDYIFEKGGITGGVLSKSGRFADRRHDIEDAHRSGMPTDGDLPFCRYFESSQRCNLKRHYSPRNAYP